MRAPQAYIGNKSCSEMEYDAGAFYDQTCVHVDGYRQIVSFDTTQVLLRCKKNMLVIEGNALRIASFDGAEITVRGDIAAVRWKVEEAEKHA